MGLQTEHPLSLGTAIGIDGYLLTIASALPASRFAAQHLAKNDSDCLIRAILITDQEEILMAGCLEGRSNVIIFIVVFFFAVAASGIMIRWYLIAILINGCQLIAILINVICVVIDSSAT